jgi:hypothetical protein
VTFEFSSFQKIIEKYRKLGQKVSLMIKKFVIELKPYNCAGFDDASLKIAPAE